MNLPRTFSIKTLGCKVNQYETQGIREEFLKAGHEEVSWQDKPDAYIINTCTVTAVSDSKSRHLIKQAAKSRPQSTIVVTGCYAEKDREEIASIPGVDFIVTNNEKHKIVNMVCGEEKVGGNGYFPFSITGFKDHTRAFIKVEDGCNNLCSFCKVPLVRGRVRSRDLSDIVSEVRSLKAKGFREIVLTGVCLGAYGIDSQKEREIADVIREIQEMGNGFRLRLSSIEPGYVTDRLIKTLANSKTLCPHLHIPLQHGDNDILRKMNRSYDVNSYKALVAKIRNLIPGISLTTDILVGFPGESEENFQNTLNTVSEVRPSRIHIFPYSPREGTAAFAFKNHIPSNIIGKRIERLKKLALEISLAYRKRFLHKQAEVLIESKRDKKSGLLAGYTDTYIRVLVQGQDNLMNRIIPVRITRVAPHYTKAEF